MPNYVYIATSLDGYIADRDGGLDWLDQFASENDYGFGDFMHMIDAIVMGRNTFDTVVNFDWPYPKKVFVLSNTLKEVPAKLAGKVEIVSGEIESVYSELKNKGFANLYIDGGRTIRQFLHAGLIDELIITRIPTILGGGSPLFGDLDKPITFKEVRTEILNDLLVKTYYKQPKIGLLQE